MESHTYVPTISFPLYRTELPPPSLPFGSPSSLLCQLADPHSLSPCFQHHSLPLLLLLLLSQCECHCIRWRERVYLLSTAKIPRRPPAPPHFVFLCICVYEHVTCVYTACICDRALTQPVNRRNILLQWIGFILKRWHGDYYSIQLHQICTVPKWYYTSLSGWVIYPFKWTFISHILKQRPWRCTIQGCLPNIGDF